jgi:hypothetical protein
MAHKFGFISEDDDQIDEDPTEYANFQYSQEQEINDNNQYLNGISRFSESPPAYSYAGVDEQWTEDVNQIDKY